MANEVTVVEMEGVRGCEICLRMPPLNVQKLTIGGAISSAFVSSFVAIYTKTACDLEFTALDGTAPDGSGLITGLIPLDALDWNYFEVRAGDQVIVVT